MKMEEHLVDWKAHPYHGSNLDMALTTKPFILVLFFSVLIIFQCFVLRNPLPLLRQLQSDK